MRNKDNAGYRGTLHDSPNRCCVLSFICAVNIAQQKASLALRMESRLEKIFSMGINIMSLAVWLGEDRKCSAAVVDLDLLLGYIRNILLGILEIYHLF